MKAIETEYRGHRFRSRLEARWAVALHEMGVAYQYEPQGFEREMGNGDGSPIRLRYLPDFYLPDFGTWVEVKGRLEAADAARMFEVMDFGGLPGTDADRPTAGTNADTGGLLLLGDVTDLSGDMPQMPLHTVIVNHKGLVPRLAMFGRPYHRDETVRLQVAAPARRNAWGYAQRDEWDHPLDGGWSLGGDMPDQRQCDTMLNLEPRYAYQPDPVVVDAYRAARGARFEHGGRP